MAKKSKMKFRGRVAANAKTQSTKKDFGYLILPDGIKEFKEVPGGTHKLDFIPYEIQSDFHGDINEQQGIAVGEYWYRFPFKIHRNIGADDETIICPTSFGKKCPVCDYRNAQLKAGVNWEDLKAFKASSRSLYALIPIDDKDHKETLHLWDMSDFLFQKQLNEELKEDENFEVFPSIDEGLTLKIRFSAEKFGKNEFAETNRIDFEERDEQYEDDILEEVPVLEECLKTLTYEQIEAMLMDVDAADVETENEETTAAEEEKPLRRKKKTAKKEEVEEPETEEKPKEESPKEEVEEEEVEEKPKKKAAKKSAPEHECPYGHKFGEDTDAKHCEDDCDKCELWNECVDKKEG